MDLMRKNTECLEHQTPLFHHTRRVLHANEGLGYGFIVNFIDFSKVFDSLAWETLWEVIWNVWGVGKRWWQWWGHCIDDIYPSYEMMEIIHHTSYIMYHTSYSIHRTSYIIHHTSIRLIKWWEILLLHLRRRKEGSELSPCIITALVDFVIYVWLMWRAKN